ncbi:MAG: thioredoxin-disulfide reductase [Candidatus Electryonea clarkiae]|nr:thioredoxin-disulfide reductase [Candidatus Electryonea clarkiae]MDP8287252.1 thioredoxin-disulfide reductase [Candidatus Electryonea clarkiae]
MSETNHYEVVIIGSGPAGYTAAIYASRANLKVLVLEGYAAGGQLMITTDVENFPGFPEGVTGPDLMDQVRKQAERFGPELRQVDVTKVELTQGSPFTVWVEDEKIMADSVIISTGATARYLGLESEDKLKGSGVSACATCDGAFFAGNDIAIVGGGDSAMEEAIFLTRFGTKVYIIHRRDELRASKIMRQRVFDNPKIEIIWDSVIEEVYGSREEGVTGLKLKNVKTGDFSDLEVQALFIAIGHTPNTELFIGQLDMEDTGYLIAEPGSSRTNIEGVFAAGDVRDSVYKQAITAAGSGCMAAIDAERWLEAREVH